MDYIIYSRCCAIRIGCDSIHLGCDARLFIPKEPVSHDQNSKDDSVGKREVVIKEGSKSKCCYGKEEIEQPAEPGVVVLHGGTGQPENPLSKTNQTTSKGTDSSSVSLLQWGTSHT